MRTTLSLSGRWWTAGLLCAVAWATPACELLVDFDRSKIPQGDGGPEDATSEGSPESGEAADASSEATLTDATVGNDGTVGTAMGDGASDAAPDSTTSDSSVASDAGPSSADAAADAVVESGIDAASDAGGNGGAGDDAGDDGGDAM